MFLLKVNTTIMIHIETIEIAGFASALKALHLPFGKIEKSLVYASTKTGVEDYGNAESLDPYIETSSRCVLDEDDLTLMQRLIKNGDEHAKVLRGIIAYAEITAPIFWWCELETYRTGHERLCSESTMHMDCRGLSGDALVKAKSEIPMGKALKKIDFFSYQCLRNIYRQRQWHRLPQWHEFCHWIGSLPLASELITIGL